MSAQTNHLNDSEEEELGALIYKSSKTAKKFLLEASGASQHSKKRVAPPSDDCPGVRKEGGKLIHESSFRYSPRSASKKLKVGETTDGSSKCTGDNIMPQQKQSQASEFKWASSDSESDNEDDSSDEEYPAEPEPSSSITSHSTSKRYNLRRASNRHARNEATGPEPELISSAASTTRSSLSSMYCAVINEDGKSAEEMEGTYTDRKGRDFVIERCAGKKYKRYCKPEDANNNKSRAILLCKHPGCTNVSIKGRVCRKHGGRHLWCKFEGCTNQRVANHLCYSHGAPRKICKHNGCTNIVKGRGVCTRHVSSVYDFALYKPRASLIYYDTICVHLFHTGIQTTKNYLQT